MKELLFEGKLVRLCPVNSEDDAKLYAKWSRDSEYMRLADMDPVNLYALPLVKDFLDKEEEDGCNFMIETIADNKRIGSIGLGGIDWADSCAWVGIGVGEKEYWGKGYGSEAMQLILKYAFTELNLHRVQLTVFDYNPRAIHSYEKCGFRVEGKEPDVMLREGKRWDVINMGILRSEWEQLH
jgi:RimJ/RimL family protein N-acetyltransferase